MLCKLEHILGSEFKQKPQQASHIIQVIDEITNYDQRCAFMSRLITYYELEKRLRQLVEMVDKD